MILKRIDGASTNHLLTVVADTERSGSGTPGQKAKRHHFSALPANCLQLLLRIAVLSPPGSKLAVSRNRERPSIDRRTGQTWQSRHACIAPRRWIIAELPYRPTRDH